MADAPDQGMAQFGPAPLWPKKRLAKVGKAIAAGEPVPEGCPSVEEVLHWYLELGLAVHEAIAGLDWESLLGRRAPDLIWRIKTIDTLRQKLRREPQFPLANIYDLAGVRFEADMTLDEQDAVVEAIEAFFRDRGVRVERKDYREDGGHSGYRAVHLVLHLAGRVEVQIRTELQGRWANAYELLADRVGRSIRYDQLPEDPALRELVLGLQELSTGLLRELENELRENRIISFDSEIGSGSEALPSDAGTEIHRAQRAEAKKLLDELEDRIREGEF